MSAQMHRLPLFSSLLRVFPDDALHSWISFFLHLSLLPHDLPVLSLPLMQTHDRSPSATATTAAQAFACPSFPLPTFFSLPRSLIKWVEGTVRGARGDGDDDDDQKKV